MMETFTPGNGVKAIKTSSPRSSVITVTLSVCTSSPAKHQLSSSSQVHDKAMAKSGFWKFILGIGILFEPFPTILATLGCLTIDWLVSTTGIYFSLFWRLGRLRPRYQGNLVSWWRLSFCFEEVHVFAVTLYGGERGRKRQPERPNVRANTLLFIFIRVLISSWGPHLSLIISQSPIFKNHHIRGQAFNMWICCVCG